MKYRFYERSGQPEPISAFIIQNIARGVNNLKAGGKIHERITGSAENAGKTDSIFEKEPEKPLKIT